MNNQKEPNSYQLGSIVSLQDNKQLQRRVHRMGRTAKRLRNTCRQLWQKHKRSQFLLQNAPDIILEIDHNMDLLYVNPAIERVLAYTPEEFLAGPLKNFFAPGCYDLLRQTLERKSIQEDQGIPWEDPARLEIQMLNRQNKFIWTEMVIMPRRDTKGNLSGIVAITRDISERKAYEKQLAQQAFYDPLTGLANRILFYERVNRIQKRAKREFTLKYSILMFDIDDFKQINDKFGHFIGDKLLIEVGQRIKKLLRPTDTIARIGGDEFAVLLENLDTYFQSLSIGKRLLQEAKEPLYIEDMLFHNTISIGIVNNRYDYTCPEDIMRDADIAMYKAKTKGKDTYQVYEQNLHMERTKTQSLHREMHQALLQKDLFLQFQPIVSLNGLHITDIEALIRWEHPSKGLLLPREFIHLTDMESIITYFVQYVLHKACTTMSRWKQNNVLLQDLNIAVNISEKQFLKADICAQIEQNLNNSGLSPKNLTLELKENALATNPEFAVSTLNNLKKLGINLHIDDFGSGYFSISNLQKLPLQSVKIDPSFITNLEQDRESKDKLKSIISLAQGFGLQVTAEGVESKKQMQILQELACQKAQGYYFCRPMNEDKLISYLQSNPERIPVH